MNLKDQVLSIAQVQELQELGFDVNKHASVEINTTINKKQYVVFSSFVQLYPEFGDDSVIERYSTMTIGDIIDILPERIHKNYYLEIGKCYVGYYCEDHISINGEVGEKLIDSLFEMLKWCIKENYLNKELEIK